MAEEEEEEVVVVVMVVVEELDVVVVILTTRTPGTHLPATSNVSCTSFAPRSSAKPGPTMGCPGTCWREATRLP